MAVFKSVVRYSKMHFQTFRGRKKSPPYRERVRLNELIFQMRTYRLRGAKRVKSLSLGALTLSDGEWLHAAWLFKYK